ncbi:MAG: polysaccharide deacetylase family protein [Promethearchaeota archaeon]
MSVGYILQNSSIEENNWEIPYVTHFWQGCNTTFTLSWDDVRLSDVKVAPIDKKYGISHTIFAPSYRSYPNKSFWRYTFLLDELFQGYDVQSHCGEHVHLSRIDLEEQEKLIKWGKTGIEELFDFTPIVFAYPYGDIGGKQYVLEYFELGRTTSGSGTEWPPTNWHLEGTTISGQGINDGNLHLIPGIMKNIYRSPGYQVFKGYGHTNDLGKTYGLTDFDRYEEVLRQIANWPDVWYTSWGELVAYEKTKDHVKFSDVQIDSNKVRFTVSTPNIDTNVYKVPITIAIVIPKSWDNPFPQIDRKYSSQYSLKHFSDSIELYLDVTPIKKSQTVTIWRNAPISDYYPPKIHNFQIETKTITQDWDSQTPKTSKYTFMRFDVIDELSNVYQVNTTVYLKNGAKFTFSDIKNPIFWKNSTYGRVLWDSTIVNTDIPQIEKEDVLYTSITAQDAFGNTLHCTIYPFGWRMERITLGNQVLLHLPDKQPSSTNRISLI